MDMEQKTRNENKLDAVIRADLKLVEAEIALASVMMVLMELAAMTIYMAILAIPALFAAVWFMYKAYRKLFYDSVFGPSCGLYQALPIPHSHRVLSKIFAAAICQLVPIAVLLIMVVFFGGMMGYGFMSDLSGLLGDIGFGLKNTGASPMETAILLSADFLNQIFNQLAYGSVIFLAVTVYQLQPMEKHTNLRKILIVAAGWLGLRILEAVEWLFDALEVELPLLEAGADLLLQVVVLAVTFRLTVRMLEKHYQKG